MTKLEIFEKRFKGIRFPSLNDNELLYPFNNPIPKLAISNAKILCNEIGLKFRIQECDLNLGGLDLIIYE